MVNALAGWVAACTASALICCGVAAAAPIEVRQPQKVALVVGNAGYDGADRLQSPLHDAQLIGQTLKGLGFETHVALDVTFDEFRSQIEWLSDEASTASVVLFYFAGHGFESEGDNFLVPVHTGIPVSAMTHAALLSHAIRLNAIRASIHHAGPPVSISLIDACRVPARGRIVRQLKRDNATHGEIIGYSTADQGLAYDSVRTFGIAADDSPFAYFLANNLKKAGVTIKQALEQTQQQVAAATDFGQQPWIASGLNGDFIIAGNEVHRSTGGDRLREVPRDAQAREKSSSRGVGGTSEKQVDDTWARLDTQIAERARNVNDVELARLREGASHGDVIALTTLGVVYANGGHGAHPASRAIDFYKRAADQHFPIAQTLLGELYASGQFAPINLDRAESLFAQASDAGFERAKLDLLDLRMRRGQGAPDENMHAVAGDLLEQFRRAIQEN